MRVIDILKEIIEYLKIDVELEDFYIAKNRCFFEISRRKNCNPCQGWRNL